MAMEKFDNNDPEAANRIQAMLGPQAVDRQIRSAIQFCWMSLPAKKKTVDSVEKEIRRVVERALRDFRKDSTSFGFGGDTLM
jgi:hypothetical protein